ncbi:hypothetical protein J3E68DRAFT_439389 [Trichoderma sp. SZMC 28012]
MPSQTSHQDVHHHGPPLPLPSHGVFRLLQSNTDPQSPHGHYYDLFEPSDMFVSLHEEKTLPPSEDPNALNSDPVPHEQDLGYEGDLWLVLKNSAFWYHKYFCHGISMATGNPEDLCRSYCEWIAIVSDKKKHPKAEDEPKRHHESSKAKRCRQPRLHS